MLIMAIGAQNAFVLRQGLRREHVMPVVLVCALSDAVLLQVGVWGMGGVLLARPDGGLDVARPAPKRGMKLPFPVWMALARATAEPVDEDAQPGLVEAPDPMEPDSQP